MRAKNESFQKRVEKKFGFTMVYVFLFYSLLCFILNNQRFALAIEYDFVTKNAIEYDFVSTKTSLLFFSRFIIC